MSRKGQDSLSFKVTVGNPTAAKKFLEAYKLLTDEELSDLSSKENLSSLEQSNTLLKLRDTLCDHQDGRESLTKPSGISRFPNNTAYMFFTLMTIVLLVVAGFIVGEELDWRTT